MIGQLSDEVECVAIDLSDVASLGATNLSMVFDARKRAEQSKRARKELVSTQPSPDLGPCPPDRQDAAPANDESWIKPEPGRQFRQGAVRNVLGAISDAPKRSGAAWAPGMGVTNGEATRQAPLVRSLLRMPRSGPHSAAPIALNFVQLDEIEPAGLISHKNPVYPAIAKQSLIAGSVELHFRISAEGKVYDVKSVRGSPILAGAAIEAVEAWCYEPARLNGVAIDSQSSANFDFKLN